MQPHADQPIGDDPARWRWLGEIVDRYGPGLALYASQWTTAADDCVQESLLALAAENPPPDRPVAWLYVVVRRRAMNDARSQRRRQVREQTAWQQRLAARGGADTSRELLDAVAELPDELRELVLLKTWGGLTFDEIAEVLGLSSSTLHRRYQDALERLRKMWDVPCEKMTNPE